MDKKKVMLVMGMMLLVLVVTMPSVNAIKFCEVVPFWKCTINNGRTISSEPVLHLKKYQGLEKYIFDNVSYVFNDTHVIININVNVKRWNWMLDAINSPSMAKCRKAEKVIQEDYPSFSCNKASNRNLLLSKFNKFKKQGLRLKVKTKEKGYYAKKGNHIFLTIPLDDLKIGDMIEIGENSIHYEYTENNLRISEENGTVIQDITLLNNTEQCLTDCEAEGMTTLYIDSQLFNGYDFVNDHNVTVNLNNVDIYVGTEKNVVSNVTNYTKNCTQHLSEYNISYETCENVMVCTYNDSYGNGTLIESCALSIENYYNVTNTIIDYVPYNYTNLSAGTYYWKIKAKKGSGQNLDWAISLQGFDTDTIRQYWAWWNSTWDYKRSITNLTGEYPTINISYNSNMNANFSDLRFLDYNETTELNYTIRDYMNGSWAYVTIDVNGNSSINMYYGNDNATTTSNASDTYMNPKTVHYLYGNSGDVVDALGISNGVNYNALREQTGIIDNSFYYDGLNDYTFTGYMQKVNNFSTSLWFKFDSIPTGYPTLIGNTGDGAGSIYGIQVYYDDVNGVIYYTKRGISGATISYSWTADTNWHNIVISADAINGMKMYFDGSIVANSTNTNDFNNGVAFIQKLNLGGFYNGVLNNDYSGKLDEFYAYDRELTSSEVNILYSMSDQSSTYILGSEEPQVTVLDITLNSPANNTLDNDGNVSFNCTAKDVYGATSLNLTLDGNVVSSVTNSSQFQNLTITYTNSSIPDGVHYWNCSGISVNGTNATSDSYVLTVDSVSPNVNITYPYDGFIVTEYNQTIDLNWTATDTHLDSCWYDKGIDEGNITHDVFDGVCSSGGLDHFTTNSYYFVVNANNLSKINILLTNNVCNSMGSFSLNGCNTSTITVSVSNYTSTLTHYKTQYFCGSKLLFTYDTIAGGGWLTEITFNGTETYVNCSDNHTTINYPTTNPDDMTITFYANDSAGNIGSNNVTIYKNNQSPYINLTNPIDGGVIYNQSYYVNWTINNSIVYDTCYIEYGISSSLTNKSVNCTNLVDVLIFPTEDYQLISMYANDTLGNMARSNQINVTKSFNVTIVNITSPFGTLEGLFDPGSSIYLNYTFSPVASMTSCWYAYNGTNHSIACVNGSQSFYPSYGDEEIQVCALDNLGNVGCDTNTWGYQAVLLWNDTNKESFTEGELMNFSALLYSTTGFTPYIIFNGTANLVSTTSVGTNFYNLSYTEYAPQVTLDPEIIPYYWYIEILSTNYTGVSRNISVYNITLDDCSSNPNLLLNVTGIYDESDLTRILMPDENVSLGADIFIYTADKSNLVTSYHYDGSEFVYRAFCTDLNFSLDYVVDIDLTYYGNSTYLTKRNWYMTDGVLPLNGRNFTERTMQNVSLYLLDPTSTVESPEPFVFNYYDSNNALVDNAIIHIYRRNIGSGLGVSEIGRSKSDDEGNYPIDLTPDTIIYKQTVTVDGKVVYDSGGYSVLTCVNYLNGYCTVDLGIGVREVDQFATTWYEIDGGTYSVTVDDSTRTVKLEFEYDSSNSRNVGNITYFSVYVPQYNGTYVEVDTVSAVGESGTLSITIPQVAGGNYTSGEDYYSFLIKKNQSTMAWGDFSLEKKAYEFFGDTFGLFLALLIIMTLGLMASSGGTLQIVFLIIGLVVTSTLGLVKFGTAETGFGLVIYFVIAGGIMIWKLASSGR